MNIVTVFLSLLVLTASYDCPLAPQYQSTCFTGTKSFYLGTLHVQSQSSTAAQDLQYKNTYSNALG